MSADEVSPSNEWDDRWETHRLLEILEIQNLVKVLQTKEYGITDAGKYHLQKLKEHLEYEEKTTALLNEINQKLDQERADRIAADAQASEESRKQKRTDSIRFAFNAATGVISAVAAVIGAVFALLSFFS